MQVTRDDTRTYGRAATLLTLALATAGALAYLFFAVASHTLNGEDYGQIVVLWSVVFLTVSTLFRPIEQLLATTVAELDERGQPLRAAVRVAAGIQLWLAAAFVALALILRTFIENRLFEGQELYFWTLVAAVLAFSASYFARGFFAGSRRMGSYASLLVMEGAARLGLALVVAIGLAEGASLIAIAIAIAPLASLVVVPVALRRMPVRPVAGPEQGVATEGAPEFTLSKGGGFAAAVLLIMLSEQVLLNSGVLFVRIEEGAVAAGFIFNVLMVARAPVVLFAAVAAALLPHLTRLRSRGGASEGEFASSVRSTLLVIVAFAGAASLGLLAIGPWAMGVAFGDNFKYDRAGLVIMALGMGFYLAAATLNQAALAQGQVRRAAACWAGCAIAFVAWNSLPLLDAFRRIEAGFAGSAALLCLALLLVYRNPKPVRDDQILPGSTHELEATLAAADEAG